MRPIPSNKKSSYDGAMHRSGKNNSSRGYGGGHSSGGGGNNLVLESNGPEGKIRGTARQIADKYMGLARDALSSGDHVAAEGFSQHAEHYLRILSESGGHQSGHFSDHKRHHKRHEGAGETLFAQQSQSPVSSESPPVIPSVASPEPETPLVSPLSTAAVPADLPLDVPPVEPNPPLKRSRRNKKALSPSSLEE